MEKINQLTQLAIKSFVLELINKQLTIQSLHIDEHHYHCMSIGSYIRNCAHAYEWISEEDKQIALDTDHMASLGYIYTNHPLKRIYGRNCDFVLDFFIKNILKFELT